MAEEAPETPAGEQACERGQHRPGGGLEHRTVNLAPEDGYLVAEHDHFNGEVGVVAHAEPDPTGGGGTTPGGGTRGTPPDARWSRHPTSTCRSQPSDGILGSDTFGVEGTGSHGIGLARFLRRQ